jgi:hypothetical protein
MKTHTGEIKEIVLNVWMNFQGDPHWWWTDSSTLAKILDVLREQDLWFDFRFFGIEAGKLDPFTTIEEVLAASSSWTNRSYVLHSQREGGFETAFGSPYISFNLKGGELWLQLMVNGSALDNCKATLIENIANFLAQVHVSLKGTARISKAFVEQQGLRYPHLRPLRNDYDWKFGHLIDAVDPVCGEQFPGLRNEVEKIVSASAPQAVKRIQQDSLVIFCWVDNLLDDAVVSQGCKIQERFLIETIAPPILGSLNALGDLQISVNTVAHDPLTAYDASKQIGYCALIADNDGGVNGKEWGEISEWAKTGQLPDGTMLSEVRIIVPYRSAAIALYDRAKANGIAKVLYVDEKGAWWDPFPLDIWQDDFVTPITPPIL